MDKKRFLTNGLIICGFTALILASIPFMGSLKPSLRAEANLHRVDIQTIEPGKMIVFKHPYYSYAGRGYTWHVMMYKKQDGSIRAWDIPKKGEFFGMPDFHWWNPWQDCLNFGPSITDGKIDESKPIQCRDTNTGLSKYIEDIWKWDIDGNRLSINVTNMEKTLGVVEDGFFVFLKREN